MQGKRTKKVFQAQKSWTCRKTHKNVCKKGNFSSYHKQVQKIPKKRTNTTKKSDTGFTGTFRKIDKATKTTSPLVISVDCTTKFYELKDVPKPGDDATVISSGIANPDHKLFAYIEKGCK